MNIEIKQTQTLFIWDVKDRCLSIITPRSRTSVLGVIVTFPMLISGQVGQFLVKFE